MDMGPTTLADGTINSLAKLGPVQTAMETAATANSPAAYWLKRPSVAANAPQSDSRVREQEALPGHSPRMDYDAPGNGGAKDRPTD
eukprot:4971495-Pyramimonas_sp.AAC.1